jgi:hypothetical protein
MRPQLLALQQAQATCLTHRQALDEALDDLSKRSVEGIDLEHLGKEDRRLLDQFAYRYTRLQDDMGARLMPAALLVLGEEVAAMPVLDRLNRLEQIGWLPSADEWAELRRIRNEFDHDYLETATERLERLQLAVASAWRVLEILAHIQQYIAQRFPASQS